jgi:ABC-type molybdate transport system permease subunit
MLLLQSGITVVYYALVALMAAVLAREFVRERDWQREVLYLVVLIPLVLRLVRLK